MPAADAAGRADETSGYSAAVRAAALDSLRGTMGRGLLLLCQHPNVDLRTLHHHLY